MGFRQYFSFPIESLNHFWFPNYLGWNFRVFAKVSSHLGTTAHVWFVIVSNWNMEFAILRLKRQFSSDYHCRFQKPSTSNLLPPSHQTVSSKTQHSEIDGYRWHEHLWVGEFLLLVTQKRRYYSFCSLHFLAVFLSCFFTWIHILTILMFLLKSKQVSFSVRTPCVEISFCWEYLKVDIQWYDFSFLELVATTAAVIVDPTILNHDGSALIWA